MTTGKSRRTALIFVTLAFGAIALDVPAALAASPVHSKPGTANAATVHHAHRRHADPASAFAYAPPESPIHYRAAPSNVYNEPYYGASQGYAPGEKEQFLQ